MSHTVRDWMSSPVIVIDADCSVSYALTLMRRRNVHSLVVNIPGETPGLGILTTTDIRDKIIACKKNPAETRVQDVMTSPIITADPNWSLTECSIQMQAHQIHHMPVSDESGNLIGIISDTDLFISAEEVGWEQIG